MAIADWRATAIITALTFVVSGLLIVTHTNVVVAMGAGFIPALASGTAALPGGLPLVVPVWLTPLTATLVHANWVHLILNLVMLVYCGQQSERALGKVGVVVLYLVGAYAAALGQWVQGPDVAAPMIGASGAISAIVAAYALFYGDRRASAIGPIPADVVHIVWLAAAWIGIQTLVGFAGMSGGIAIAVGAHVGGFLAGLVLARPLLLWRYRRA